MCELFHHRPTFLLAFYWDSLSKKVRLRTDYTTARSRFFRALPSNKKVRETVFVCSYAAQVESFKPKQLPKILVTLPLLRDCLNRFFQWLEMLLMVPSTV